MLLAGKVAVVTGGGRGIGRAIVLKFAGEGAAVVLAAHTESEIEAVAKEIRDAGGRHPRVPADVADEKHCERLISASVAQFGRIDILVNNAGEYGPVKPVEEITPPEWDRVIDVHLRGAQGENVSIDSRSRSGRRSQVCPRERNMPGSGNGN